MLSILGRSGRLCDGPSRRDLLTVGTLSLLGLGLPDFFRQRASARPAPSRPASGFGRAEAVILLYLQGSPSHIDLWDPKPAAPAEIRGEFKPIATKVPGILIGETFPQIAARMDKFSIIRSIVGSTGGHDAFQCTTGYPENSMAAIGGRPSMGAVVSRMMGPVDPSVPRAAYAGPPSRTMSRTLTRVSTLLTTVGFPKSPSSTGNGGLLRGSPR